MRVAPERGAYWDKTFIGGALYGENIYSKHFYRAQFGKDHKPQQHLFNELSRAESTGLPGQRRSDGAVFDGGNTVRYADGSVLQVSGGGGGGGAGGAGRTGTNKKVTRCACARA